MKWSVFCLVTTVLCNLLENIYIVQIAKRRTRPVSFQHANTFNYSTLSVICTLKHIQDLCVSLLFAQYRYTYIAICNTKQYIYKTYMYNSLQQYVHIYVLPTELFCVCIVFFILTYLVPSPTLGLANAPIVETKFLDFAMTLLDFSPRIPLGTFSILLFKFVSLFKSDCNILGHKLGQTDLTGHRDLWVIN